MVLNPTTFSVDSGPLRYEINHSKHYLHKQVSRTTYVHNLGLMLIWDSG